MTINVPSANRRSERQTAVLAIGLPTLALMIGSIALIRAFSVQVLGVPVGALLLLLYPAMGAFGASLIEDRRLALCVAAIVAAIPVGLILLVVIYEDGAYSPSAIREVGAMLLSYFVPLLAATLVGAMVMRRGTVGALIAGSALSISIVFLSQLAWQVLANLG